MTDAERLLALATAALGENEDKSDSGKRKSQATQLVELAVAAGVELFHTPEQEPYADIFCHDHRETWPVRSKAFRHWLAGLFYEKKKSAVSGQAMQDAIAVLSSQALFGGETRQVATRIAEHAGCIYVDLANERWQVVRIWPDGWEVTNASPVPFRRARGMRPLPHPVRGGDITLLRDVVNVKDDQSWTLLVAWLLAALRPRGPFPVLCLSGEQGSGKSRTALALRNLIDPSSAPLRATPRDTRDLMIAAANSWIVAYDNLSRIEQWLSDALCRLSTGGGLSTRELYTDADETILEATRPVILTSITDVVTRPDLLDRALLIELEPMADEARREERELDARLDEIQPAVLGALFDAVAHGLRHLPSVRLAKKPRMADFAVWVTACAPALGWTRDRFLSAYLENRSAAVEVALDASPVVAPLREFVAQQRGAWEGRATDLLKALNELVDDTTRRQQDWPARGHALSAALRRLAPGLRAGGLMVTFDRTYKKRSIRLEQVCKTASRASGASCPTQNQRLTPDALPDAPDALPDAPDAPMTLSRECVSLENISRNDAHDAHDALLQSCSNDVIDGDPADEDIPTIDLED